MPWDGAYRVAVIEAIQDSTLNEHVVVLARLSDGTQVSAWLPAYHMYYFSHTGDEIEL